MAGACSFGTRTFCVGLTLKLLHAAAVTPAVLRAKLCCGRCCREGAWRLGSCGLLGLKPRMQKNNASCFPLIQPAAQVGGLNSCGCCALQSSFALSTKELLSFSLSSLHRNWRWGWRARWKRRRVPHLSIARLLKTLSLPTGWY